MFDMLTLHFLLGGFTNLELVDIFKQDMMILQLEIIVLVLEV